MHQIRFSRSTAPQNTWVLPRYFWPDGSYNRLTPPKQMLQPLYTMNGFNWFDQGGVEGVGFVRTLRTLLTNNIPKLLPDLGALTRTRWAQMLADKGTADGNLLRTIYNTDHLSTLC